jgi:hypothetical protein
MFIEVMVLENLLLTKSKITMKKLIVIAALALCSCLANAQEDRKQNETQTQDRTNQENMGKDKISRDNMSIDNRSANAQTSRMNPDIANWPKASQMAAKEMMGKYGQPDGVTENELTWRDKGNWKKICVTKMETRHDFPMAHTDMLSQYVSMRVPVEKADELLSFDGSVTIDRTQGLISARCDKEENNILALNLAYDIIKGKRSVDDARKELAKNIMDKKNGGNPELMQKLTFTPDANAPDPDKPVSDKMGMVK